ncbi:MAG: hypothetical protein FWG26_07120 [Betaproteobacteria bacterium]|jgi:hypothetical protein|nr:hypothetical protein [Betaproteobacteria bacterium]
MKQSAHDCGHAWERDGGNATGTPVSIDTKANCNVSSNFQSLTEILQQAGIFKSGFHLDEQLCILNNDIDTELL